MFGGMREKTTQLVPECKVVSEKFSKVSKFF